MKSRPVIIIVAIAALATLLAACGGGSSTGVTSVAGAPKATATATAKSIDGKTLYQALLNTKVEDSELPSGITNAKVGSSQPSDRSASNHASGSVEIDVDGSDAQDGIAYIVFPTAKDASNDWDNGKTHVTSGVKITATQVPAGFSYPALEANGSITGKNAFGTTLTNGGSNCSALVGQVIVSGVTVSTDNTDSGNVPVSCDLLRAGIAHLLKVQAGL